MRTEIHVATDGDDKSDGSAESPVATLTRAVKLARKAKPARIVVRGGTYFGGVTLEAPDSGLEIVAAEGEEPVIMAGRQITGWVPCGGRLWSAKLPEVAARKWDFRMLLVDGERAKRARLPREGYFENLSVFDVPWMSTTGGGWQRKPTDDELRTMIYKPGDLGPWLDTSNAEVTVYHYWDVSHMRVAAIDDEAHTLRFLGSCGHPPGAFGKHRYIVWNVREGMTEPGQWYLDRAAGRVVYWPQPWQDMMRAEVVAPTACGIIEGWGVGSAYVARDVTVRGLTLSVTDVGGGAGGFGAFDFPGAVGLQCAEDWHLIDLTIAHTGGSGIMAHHCPGLRVEGCEIADTGGCGINVRSSDGAVVSDNHVHHTGAAYPSAIAVNVSGKGCLVSHNEIHDTTYSGITSGGEGNTIEYNLIYDVMREMADGGAIYITFCKDMIVRGNVVRDLIETGGYGASAYYLDEQAEGCVVEKNLALRVTRPSHNHMAWLNVLRNNVFVADGDVMLSFPKCEQYTMERNVVCAGGKIRIEGAREQVRYVDNVFHSGTGVREWVPVEVEAEEPGFRDPVKGDFGFEEGSLALALGIEGLDEAQAGRRK